MIILLVCLFVQDMRILTIHHRTILAMETLQECLTEFLAIVPILDIAPSTVSASDLKIHRSVIKNLF